MIAWPAHRSGLAPRSLAMLLVLLVAVPAVAEVSPRDLQVVARALSFTEPPVSGEIRVGVVYDADDPRSRERADRVIGLFNGGLRSGDLILVPVAVSFEDVDEAPVELFFLTEGAGPEAPRLGAAARARQLPCVTLDLEQVRRGHCLMGVRSSPRVEILVNRAVAEASGIRFAAVFRMMIVEL